MPATTTATRENRRAAAPRKRKKKKSANLLLAWWPLLLGIAVTPFAIHTASIMALAGPGALITLYPYVVLLKNPALGLSNDIVNNLSQWMMYLQFALYGLLMALMLRSKKLWVALATAAVAHFACVLVVLMISRAHLQ
jgi:hypothetical protein